MTKLSLFWDTRNLVEDQYLGNYPTEEHSKIALGVLHYKNALLKILRTGFLKDVHIKTD